jgi:hypothetical protein
VLCDLQGGIYRTSLVLSDPVILSRTREYGVTDLGRDGILSFFAQHACNAHCRPGWTRPAGARQVFDPVPGTTMVPTAWSRPAGTTAGGRGRGYGAAIWEEEEEEDLW